MVLSLSKAAREGKVAKTTLQRALENGDISATKSERGRWQIDESELGRWLTSRSTERSEPVFENRSGTPSGTPEKTGDPELEKRDFMIERLELEIEKLEAERDDWKDQAKMLLLNPPPLRSRRPQGIKGFLQRVWGSSGHAAGDDS